MSLQGLITCHNNVVNARRVKVNRINECFGRKGGIYGKMECGANSNPKNSEKRED